MDWFLYDNCLCRERVKLWKMRNLTLEWRIVIFKTLAVSNIVFKLLINIIPNHIIFELIIFQKEFCGKSEIQI